MNILSNIKASDDIILKIILELSRIITLSYADGLTLGTVQLMNRTERSTNNALNILISRIHEDDDIDVLYKVVSDDIMLRTIKNSFYSGYEDANMLKRKNFKEFPAPQHILKDMLIEINKINGIIQETKQPNYN